MKTRKCFHTIIGLVLVTVISEAFIQDSKSKPWNGTRQIIPGKIITAFYDDGGEGVGFHNPAAKNNGSEGIGLARNGHYEVGISITRPATDKFMDGTTMPFDKYYIGWIVAGEWLNYSVEVKTDGTYLVNMLASSARDKAAISLSVDGIDKTSAITLETTGHVHTWRLFTNVAEIELDKGPHVLTLKFIKEGFMNVQYLEFVPKVTPTTSISSSKTSS